MNQLGGIRLSVRVDRASCAEECRFGFRTLPAARRSRRRFAAVAIVFVLFAVASAVGSLSDGKPLGEAIGSGVWFLGLVAIYSLFASSRVRAWMTARQAFKDLPDEHVVVYRFDESGYDVAGGGRSSHYDWSAITAVV